jgi:hypothetical protein
LGSGANYTLYGADVTAFAGSVGELRFCALSTPENRYHNVFLDSIAFSPEVVPEPSALALVGGGLSLFLLFSYGRKQK